jgi:hypothetical protein
MISLGARGMSKEQLPAASLLLANGTKGPCGGFLSEAPGGLTYSDVIISGMLISIYRPTLVSWS